MDTIELTADRRELTGKKVRRLRRQGLIPANLFGPKIESVPLQIEAASLHQALVQGGHNAIITVTINGEKNPVTSVVRGLQSDPITDELLHVDLFEIDVTQVITADIPVILIGESPAAKGQGAVISHSLNSIQVQGRPMDLPRAIEVDISGLAEIDQEIRLRDLTISDNISLLTDKDQLVVKAARARVVVEEVIQEGVEAIEGEVPEEEPAPGDEESPN